MDEGGRSMFFHGQPGQFYLPHLTCRQLQQRRFRFNCLRTFRLGDFKKDDRLMVATLLPQRKHQRRSQFDVLSHVLYDVETARLYDLHTNTTGLAFPAYMHEEIALRQWNGFHYFESVHTFTLGGTPVQVLPHWHAFLRVLLRRCLGHKFLQLLHVFVECKTKCERNSIPWPE